VIVATLVVTVLSGHVRATLRLCWWSGRWRLVAVKSIFSGDVSVGAGMHLCLPPPPAVGLLISMMLFLARLYAAYHRLVLMGMK